MKIQHWAIIFIIIILPISIICRNVISKKNLLLRDETRYNNIIDNATYDAVSQILEVSEELGYGKNIPITEGVADAAIDRFFNTLSVNFNMPIGRELAESYFCQYIPAIIIIGYDGLYIYSYEQNASGYDFVLKPKIPYSCTYTPEGSSESVVINFTLDNYVKIYFQDYTFMKDLPDINGNINKEGTHVLEGYIGNYLDVDQNGVDDLNDMLNSEGILVKYDSSLGELYADNDDPYGINNFSSKSVEQKDYILNVLPSFTDNLSYILQKWADNGSVTSRNIAYYLTIFYDKNAGQDYVYNDQGDIVTYASEFNQLRRETIINLITSVLKQEFNEHNSYADYMGITYNFNIPDIGRDQWNNTIDDISVLAFFQGMPMGSETYYNNYSLGGARIVKANYLYAETVTDGSDIEHRVYHKYYCPLIPRDINGNPKYSEGTTIINGTLPDGSPRITTGIEQIFINSEDAKEAGYYICSECM